MILITGASSGLGAALAEAYAGPGQTLALIGRDEVRLDAVAETCRRAGAAVVPARLDVADLAPLATWIADFDAKHPIDTLVANAGVSAGPLRGHRQEGLASCVRQVEVNLFGVMATVEATLPGMLARRRGRIGIVSSIASLRGLPYGPGYSASKAGARAYGEALRALVAPTGASVSVITPRR